jgi:hypothetical protein
MQPDPVRVEETLAWMKKSRKDLWRAESVLTLDPPDTEDCLFHCQQAVEKSLKAFLVWRDQSFRRTIWWNSPGSVRTWNQPWVMSCVAWDR